MNLRKKNAVLPNDNSRNLRKTGRITSLLKDGSLFSDLSTTDFNATNDRAMVYGSMGLDTNVKRILEDFGLSEGANSDPSNYIVEKAFVG